MRKIWFLVVFTMLFSCNSSSERKNNSDEFDPSKFEEIKVKLFTDITDEERKIALKSLNEMAENGFLPAQTYLGCMLLNGAGGHVEKNESRGLEYLLLGLEESDSDAIFCLAEYYYSNEEIADYKNVLRLGSNLKDTYAMHELGYFLISGRTEYFATDAMKSWEDEKEIDKGLALLKESSNLGNTISSYRIGLGYLKGLYSLSPDSTIAKEFFDLCLDDPEFVYFDQLSELSIE